MNRKERRRETRDFLRYIENEPTAIPVNVSPVFPGLKQGETFKIKGIKITSPGRFITDCKQGEETLLVCDNTINSVFKLNKNEADLIPTVGHGG